MFKQLCLVILWGGAVLELGASESDTVRQLLAEAQTAAANRHTAQAMAALNQIVASEPGLAVAYYLRGREYLRQGQFAQSVADFDRYLELQPQRQASLWERGIACYYAGQFQQGADQFSAYQTFDDNDVENAVWHVICRSQLVGFAEASSEIMRVKADRRVPMMQVYDLFRGAATPADVLSAARSMELRPDERKLAEFYAHLYLGLYYEVRGERESSQQAIRRAVEDHVNDNYMWDVAQAHARRPPTAARAASTSKPDGTGQ